MTNKAIQGMTLPMDAIRAYCKKWGILELALFGSILREDFSENSDVDVLVVFHKDTHPTFFDIVTMTDELEIIFKHKVDLLTRKSVEDSQNYIRRKAILDSARVIYAQ